MSSQIEKRTSQLPEKATCRQRQISYGITYTRNLKKPDKWTYLPKRNRVTDVENELTVTRGQGKEGKNWDTGIDIYKLLYLCLTLCDPVNCSPLSSSVHRIIQARIPEWVAISFSRGSSQPRDLTQVSCTAAGFSTVWVTREAYTK